MPASVEARVFVGKSGCREMLKYVGEIVEAQKSGQVRRPVDVNGLEDRRGVGSWRGRLSASSQMVLSKEEKRRAKDLIWKCSIVTLVFFVGSWFRVMISERMMHFALRAGRMVSQIYGSYSVGSLTKSSTGNWQPVRRSIRKVTTNVGMYVPPAAETMPSVPTI